ncbi:response regulator [Leptolyngbya sp. AN03gr2]|uniref:response regulator n=1 Tax=unclassified Leptolyngbya TaxID=2650499 RepID=UPI003D31FADE
MRILLIESEPSTAATIATALSAQQHSIDSVDRSQMALEMIQAYDYDLLILDAGTDLEGISLCRSLRSQNYFAPVLMLMTTASSRDRVQALNAGVDDCLVKPFDIAELVARVQSLLRRRSTSFTATLTWDALQLHPDTRRVTWQSIPLNLTAKEFRLLQLFLENPLRIFSKDVILDRLWDASEAPGEGTVAAHVKGLRQKLKTIGISSEVIETIYGLGYRLNPPPTERQSTSRPLPERTALQQEILAEVAAVQAELRASLNEEIAVFEQVAAQLATGQLEPSLRQQAQYQAHQLIGTLGSIGLPGGSQVAQQIDQLLQETESLGQTEARQLLQLVRSLSNALEATPAVAIPTLVPKVQPSRLLIIDDDVVLTKLLRQAAIAAGFQVEIATTLQQGREILRRSNTSDTPPPNAVLLDLIFPDSDEDGLSLLSELAEQNSTIPVVALTVRNSLRDRITVARLGGQAFLHKPISLTEVLRVVTKLLNPAPPPEAKILIVDSEPKLLEQLIELLPPWGLQVTTLADPEQFWEVLTATAPDLLILAVEMPKFSGIELCQVVRQAPQWADLPILLMTPYGDADIIHQVFDAGADDFVGKPIIPPELIARITRRLEWSRLRRRNKP